MNSKLKEQQARAARMQDINQFQKMAEQTLEEFKRQIRGNLNSNGGKSYTEIFRITDLNRIEPVTIEESTRRGIIDRLSSVTTYTKDVYYSPCMYIYDEIKKFCRAEGIQISEPKIGVYSYRRSMYAYLSGIVYQHEFPADKSGYIRVKYKVESGHRDIDFHFEYRVIV